MPKKSLETVPFTEQRLAKLEPRKDGKERLVRCAGLSELVISISPYPHGKKSFAVYKSHLGKPWRKKVSDYFAGIDIEQVKKNAIEMLNELNSGNDPKKKRIENTLTFLDAFNRWKDDAIARKKRTVDRAQWNVDKHLVPIHKKLLSEITTDDVASIVNKLASKKKPALVQANRQIEMISRIFNFVKKRFDFQGRNPALHFEKFQEAPSQKFMTEEQFKKFIETTKQEENVEHRHILLLLAFTACRVSCGVQARFEEFNLEAKTWRIPALKSKNGREMVLPLNSAALQVISERRKLVEGEYLFPKKVNKKTKSHLWVRKCFEKVCKKAGITGMVVHSIRKSFGAFALNTLKLPLYEVSKLLCHSNTRITEKAYARLEDKTLSASSDLIANALG